MASLQNNKSNNCLQSDDDTDIIHILDITNGSFPERILDHIESSDTIEFKTDSKDEYDTFQVYKDGINYYRINNGLELLNIKNNAPENKRPILLSFTFNHRKMELYFCIIPSSQRPRSFIPVSGHGRIAKEVAISLDLFGGFLWEN